MPTLFDLRTPSLVLERRRLRHNIDRMAQRMRGHGVALRPHLKTSKCAEVARLATAGQSGGITVSTLAEAAFFIEQGFRDVTYAVGIVPEKLAAVATLQREARVQILTDDVGVARAIVQRGASAGIVFDVLIEIDTGGGRGGVIPESEALLEIGHILHESSGARLAGVLTHAGHSYHCSSIEQVRGVAESERRGVVRAATRLIEAELPCPIVSAGSTPTAVHAGDLTGVTEMRPGNYVFFDLAQVGIGSCDLDDIAVSVLATVIGRVRPSKGWLIDAGSLALSSDTSASEHWPGIGYGMVCDVAGRPLDGLRVARVNQEHGFLEGEAAESPALQVGSRVRILPNHACITAAMFDVYQVIDNGPEVIGTWQRVRGW